MIIVGKATPSTKTPGMLATNFNCLANEATPVFMDIDAVFVYLDKGQQPTIDVPADWALKEGAEIPFHQIAGLYSQQHKDFNMVWTAEELPDPSALRANPALPYLKL